MNPAPGPRPYPGSPALPGAPPRAGDVPPGRDGSSAQDTPDGREARRIPVPAAALDQWLSDIDDAAELKVTLRVVGLVCGEPIRRRGLPPSVALDELLDDATLRRAAPLGSDASIRQALGDALGRGTLAAVRVGGEIRVMVNDRHARDYLAGAGLALLAPADVSGPAPEPGRPAASARGEAPRRPARPNIFALYEEHIGTYGHGMAEQLKAAEEEYPARWIADAFAIAAHQNVRSWGYVRAILQGWLREGKPPAPSPATTHHREQRYEHGKPGHDPAPDRRTGYLESYRQRHGRLPWEPDDGADGAGGADGG